MRSNGNKLIIQITPIYVCQHNILEFKLTRARLEYKIDLVSSYIPLNYSQANEA